MPTQTNEEGERLIQELVDLYDKKQQNFRRMAEFVSNTIKDYSVLADQVHSVKFRSKDPLHLKDKLRRKLVKCKETEKDFDISADNLFEKITDLAGVRVIHLHNKQLPSIHAGLLDLFEENLYELVENAVANTWDDESKDFYESIGISTRSRTDNMYTSVHYVIAANTKSKERCEIQVRTLMEEVWGEVDHTINYPQPSSNIHCREQLKVLARLTSSCTRLVDSIFLSYNHGKDLQK